MALELEIFRIQPCFFTLCPSDSHRNTDFWPYHDVFVHVSDVDRGSEEGAVLHSSGTNSSLHKEEFVPATSTPYKPDVGDSPAR